jgi:glycosyltransferase involved in cell wall biosynthesis
MALGVPVVASGLPGNLEVLDNAGVVIPPNDPRALADAVVMLIGDSARRADLAARGRERTTLWFPGRMADGVLGAYQGLGLIAAPKAEAV